MQWFHRIFSKDHKSTFHITVWKYQKLSLFLHYVRKNFVKAMALLKKLLNSWFDEIFFSEREFLVFHTVHTSTRSPFLRKNCHFPRQIDQINVTNELISRKFFSVIAFHCTFLHYEATSDYFHEKIGKICILTHP